MKKQRIMLISIASILIFGLLLGGRVIYQKKWLDANILTQSQLIPGVVSAKTIQNNGQNELVVVTNHLTNLRQACLALEKLAGESPIRYLDTSNDELNLLFEQMQFALQEGVARGNFIEMAQNVQAQAAKAGVQLELQMDSDSIYVLMNHGNAQLIEVISRKGQVKFLPSEKE